MRLPPAVNWADRLVRISLALLLLAVGFGLVVGAAIAMYYDLTPTMGVWEDTLTSLQLSLYLLSIMVSLPHLLLGLWDGWHGLRKQALCRVLLFVGPLFVFLGTEGVVSHFLWWEPISHTDRFHLLHHTLVAGVPLAGLYWLSVRRWWYPSRLESTPSFSRRFRLISRLILSLLVVVVGVITGFSPVVLILVALALISSSLPLFLDRAGEGEQGAAPDALKRGENSRLQSLFPRGRSGARAWGAGELGRCACFSTLYFSQVAKLTEHPKQHTIRGV